MSKNQQCGREFGTPTSPSQGWGRTWFKPSSHPHGDALPHHPASVSKEDSSPHPFRHHFVSNLSFLHYSTAAAAFPVAPRDPHSFLSQPPPSSSREHLFCQSFIPTPRAPHTQPGALQPPTSTGPQGWFSRLPKPPSAPGPSLRLEEKGRGRRECDLGRERHKTRGEPLLGRE